MGSAIGLPLSLLMPNVFAREVPSPRPRMRLEDFVQDEMRLESLKRGVAVMKARKPSEPGSWFYQGAIHAVTEEAIQAALDQDPNVANVDQARFWNRCPHNGESSADFLIWHRAYIFYFENFLREASGDPTFSLPYWNYTELSQRQFPQHFADDDADPVTQAPRNPLYSHRREQAFAFGLYQLSEGVAGTGVIFSETDFFGLTEDTGFAGGVSDSNVRTKGRIERQPHDLMHFAIGGAIGTGETDTGEATSGMMASVATAAFDPIFWVHHANIDRLWTVWDCLLNPVRSWGKVPPKEWLEDKPWFFNDVGGGVRNHSRIYYIDRRSLNVAYDSDSLDCKPLSATNPLSLASVETGVAPLSVSEEVKSFAFKAEAGRVDKKIRVSPDQLVSTKVPLSSLPELGGGSMKSNVLSAQAGTPLRLVLDLMGIEIEGVTSVGYDVYVNLPADQTPARTSKSYVGTVSLFGSNHSHGEHNGHGAVASQRFDITRALLLDEFDEKMLTVSIVPFDLLEPLNGRPRLRRAVGITYSGVRIIVLEGVSSPVM
jgi:hypothetical protein